MGTDYNLSKIRTLLTESFTDQELRLFCYETPGFRPVYDQLAANTGKTEIISRLLEFAERRIYLHPLLAWANEQNPAQYAKHQPYEAQTRASGATLPPAQLTSSQPLRVFLCHAAADKPAVRDLYDRLQGEGFIEPWLDEEELLPGQDWQREIPKAVRASDVVLVCLSPQSVTKAGYVQKEIRFALDIADEQPEGTIFLIPLRLELCDVPERLHRWHWANLFEARGYERLLRSLRRRAEAIGINVTLRPQAEESPPSRLIPESPQPTPAPPPTGSQVVSSPPVEIPPAKRGMLHSVQRDTELTPPTPPDRVTITTPIQLELVRVPAGEFLMGSDPTKDKNANYYEQPQHRVYVSEFYISKYPVTNEQYAAFVKATEHKPLVRWKEGTFPSGKENHPVVLVSWDDAVAFCHWLSQASGQSPGGTAKGWSFRLPTEAEWEKAARGPDGRIYPWGNQWDKTKLNSKNGGPGDTTPVGRYSPGGDSPYGAADMAGNVWEWCADWYGEKEYQRRAKSVIKDPAGPKQGDFRVLRGGAFDDKASRVRCAGRFSHFRNIGPRSFGLRVVGGGPFPSEALNH